MYAHHRAHFSIKSEGNGMSMSQFHRVRSIDLHISEVKLITVTLINPSLLSPYGP